MANTANTTALTTNFNVTPYYDDYDPSSGYYRILFKPGYAVQARELTQMQTALQEQIARFGKNIFKDGTIVIPGSFTLETNNGLPAGRGIRYVKVKDVDASNNTVNMSTWETFIDQGKANGNTRLEIVGLSSNIRAKVVQVLDGVQTSSNTKTLYVSYTTGSSVNTSVKVFQAGETLRANVNNTVYTLVVHDTDAAKTGIGSRFSISSGVLWAKNHFIAFPDQSVIISRYDPNPTARVGFYITEDIIKASQDATLLDPAQEASNYSAPGADRLMLNPTLQVVPIDAAVDVQDFVSLFTIENGVVKTYNANTQYSYINDAMARRTYDNSGDYVVAGLDVQVKEHDNTGSNYGRYANGNNSLLWVGVSPGKAYVQGYEATALATVDLSTPKGTTSKAINSQLSAANMGQYVTVDEFVGGWQFNKGQVINLYDTAQNRISTKGWSTAAQTGSLIGTAILLSVEWVSGTPGYNAKYNVYLADIKMTGTNTFGQVKSLYAAGSGSNPSMGADTVLDLTGKAVLQKVPNSTLLYYTGSNYTKTVRSYADTAVSDTSFEFNDTAGIASTVQVSTNGVFTLSISPGTEQFPYGTTTLSSSQASDLFLTFDQTSAGATSMSVGISGTSASGAGTTALVGTGTKFTRLNVGDKILLSGNTLAYYVTTITDDTHITVDANLPAAVVGNTLTKVYKSGDLINLTGVGAANGVQRAISSTSTSLQFDLKETFPSIFYVTVSYPLERTSALEISKVKKARRYVKINCANNAAGIVGPYDLGFSDAYKVRKIRLTSGAYPTSNTDGTDVTNSFLFNNGQKDTHYDHGTIKPKIALDTNSRLLVELDYFLPDFTNRGGFFTVDSYPIQDNDAVYNDLNNIRTENIPVFKSPTTGKGYDLRNYLDFRPVKTNSATDATTPAGASVNPAATSAFTFPAAGMKFPVPSSQITYDFHYYLGRIDVVVVDKDNRFQIIKGLPSANPQTPDVPPGVMALASIRVVPYPSLSPAYATLLDRPELACVPRSLTNMRYTMRDIGTLKQRIVNLEYYTSLSVLEKAASQLIIPNDDGVDRFKNGIFTDNFRDNSLGAVNDSEFRIVYDPKEKTIRPVYKMETISYNFLSGTNVKFKNPVFTIDYTEILHYKQERATADINVERQSWLFLGSVDLFPAQDIWIDTTIMPDEQLSNKSIYVVNYGTQGTSNEAITAYGTTAHIDLAGNSAYGIYTANGKFNPNTTGGVVDVLNTTQWNAWNTHVVGYKVYTGQVTSDGSPTSVQFATYDAARSYASSINGVGGAGVTVETVYNTARTGTQYWEADSADVVQTDYKVIDVQNYAYIRPQTMTVHCTGFKPHTQVWPYFDNIAMANSSRPLTANQFSWVINNGQYGLAANTVNNLSLHTSTDPAAGIKALPSTLGPWAGYGSNLITDANGRLDFQMQITKGQFRVGQRNLLVCDSRQYIDASSITTQSQVPPDISTGGQATFIASGQSITKQRSILTTKTVSYHTEAVSQNYNSAGFEYIAAPPPPAPASHSCTAYSFLAQAQNGEEGMFLTSVDIFVSRIGEKGFWCEIREMDSGQQITRNTVPYSEVFFNNPAAVPISPNGSTNPCRVTFQAPVFLYHNTQYAFIIHPINANPDLYVWVSKLGQTDLNGLGPVIDRRGMGTFYQTNNNTNWDIIPDVDLTVKFYRAEFMKNVTASAYLGNRPIERLYIYNNSIDFAGQEGDIFISGDHFTLTGANCTPAIGDFAVGKTSFQNSAMVNVSAAYAASNTGYYQGEIVQFFKADGTGYKGEATISDITNASGRLEYYINGTTSTVQLSASGGGFVVGDYIINSTDWSQYGRIDNIWSISNFRYSAFHFEPSYLKFQLTDIEFKMRPVSTTGAVGSYIDLDPSTTQYFNTEQAVLSRTNEVNQLAGDYSSKILVTMQTSSNVVSPFVDTTKTQTIIIDNVINNDTTNETLPTHGALLNKYISRVVTLEEGQDAEDIIVILSAYRPPGTDVKVWLKILNAEDPNPMSEQNWVELYKEGNGDRTFSALEDRNNFKEFTYFVPSASIDRLTLSGASATVNAGHTLVGQTSGFSATVSRIEQGPIYVMSATGYAAGETVNIVSGGTTLGTATVTYTGRTVALNGTSGGTSNVISYTTDTSVTYSTYKYFAIKIGLLNDGTNSAVVPRVGDLRAIALQK